MAGRDIPKGEKLSEALIQFKRPLTGIPAQDLDQVVGRCSSTCIAAGQLISWEQID